MEYLTIIAMLALAQYVWFGINVGSARGRFEIKAPAMTGHAEFERYVRVHANTLEQLVVFLPSLYAFGMYVHALTAAGLGVVYLIGRLMYASSYIKDPASRGTAFGVTFAPMAILLLGGLVGAIYRLF